MAINVNISVAPAVKQPNDVGLTLVIFKNALLKAASENPIRINTIKELETAFQAPTTMVQFKELYSAEYLLRAGVNLLCYAVDTPGTFDEDDAANISDLEVLDYKFIVVPYSFVSGSGESIIWDDDLKDLVDDNNIELLLDLTPFVNESAAADIVAEFSSPKISVAINSGFTGIESVFDTSEIDEDLDISEELLATPGVYAEATDYVGIPASLAILARKAKLLALETPWIPVAGEQYGVVPEFISLFRAISTVEKEAFQALNINVLTNKIGVGNLFVSQNTMYSSDKATSIHPFYRSHVITEALWIKRQLIRIAESMLFQPNNRKSWDTVSLRMKSLFGTILNSDGIENYQVYIGKDITMTESDIANGIMKAAVSYLPIRVIESVEFNITIKESENTYEVILEGGEL